MSRDGFTYWVSQDQEGWTPAGDTMRAGAIDFGTDEYNGEGFYICEARRGEYDLRILDYKIVEALELINEERINPEGDGIFSRAPTKDELSALETRVEAAIRQWWIGCGFNIEAWAFAAMRNVEHIRAERLYTDKEQRRWHARVAEMGGARAAPTDPAPALRADPPRTAAQSNPLPSESAVANFDHSQSCKPGTPGLQGEGGEPLQFLPWRNISSPSEWGDSTVFYSEPR